ncbi:MAG: sodium ion-translocating decarboxylase subunit beta, partial [Pseudomonadales bacterium]|nr:sodium ion-translocating decarboxylase subunit beta [Pseudomonadales bacterium]
MDSLILLWQGTGIYSLLDQIAENGISGFGPLLMIIVGLLLLYLAIKKGFEPLLLVPIGFGCILVNIPGSGFYNAPTETEAGGLLYYLFEVGIASGGVFPLLIFMGVGAMTDFGALIANPKTLLLGAAAQTGIFVTLFGAIALNAVPGIEFTLKDASAIAIIGGADGPTAIFL